MRILIVEDDDRIAKPLAEDLRHQHHAVEIARDGIEGLESAQEIAYDLILLARTDKISQVEQKPINLSSLLADLMQLDKSQAKGKNLR